MNVRSNRFSVLITRAQVVLIPLVTLVLGCGADLPSEHRDNVLKLEESEYPISSITSVSLNTQETLLAIGDRKAGMILVYELSSGKLKHAIVGTPDMIDSVVIKSPPIQLAGKQRWPITRDSLLNDGGVPYSDQELQETLPNRMVSPLFTDEHELLVLANLNGIYRYKAGENATAQGTYPCPAFLRYDLTDGSLECMPIPQSPIAPWPQARGPFVQTSDDEYILPCFAKGGERGQYDSLYSLIVVSSDWGIQKPTLPIPAEHRKKNLGYGFLSLLADSDREGNTFAMTSLIPKVYNVETGHSFSLKGLSASNADFFSTVDRLSREELRRSIGELQSITFTRLRITRDGTILIAGVIPGQGEKTCFVQEYNVNGELLNNDELRIPGERGEIMFVDYARSEDALMIFSLHNENGWTLSFRERSKGGEWS